ncbi:MAG: Serine/threonine protein kinase with repeat [Hydrocarboniphaga sp.]|uniref:serine/threonine-protein kinase n=1 Tax=Hydrocarboniphaga sp. TaxID=2033016 RepID=UPI0026152112|nr:serine/threonine-protein kinase [Hydrocarboniphaga sp.]MDB5969519.1 Serine/threonine protein kinase with repeat [Hydrocarboniphaga sp.]
MSETPAERLRREAYAVFESLMDLESAARDAELDALRQTRPELHARVIALLAADRSAESSPLIAAGALRALQAEAAHTDREGTDLGPYRIERALGRGGMGEVWLAHRSDGLYTAAVALKLLHAHLAQSAIRGRFLREGRILGELAHPHVARLLDAGIAASGELYLAIEYVEGERIDHWCDRRQLDIRARLQLFLQVCAAVAHAHAHLVVHRDLKPSNILIDAEGGAKLLDFGIAKLIEDDSENATELTRLGGRALTPEYAAPEQLGRGTITIATDVYALGALLYGLLSGRRPYGAPGQTAAQIEHEILAAEPPPLSQSRAARGETTTTAQIAAQRATTPRKLRISLRGDLDTIVGKTLKKNPAERYPTVLALADDLRRHLASEPVLAQPDSFAYRAGKFMRRHRVGAFAGAAVGLAFLIGIAGVIWQARIARAESLRALRVKNFVVSVFREQDPFSRPGAAARSPQGLVSEAAKRVDEELRDEPQLHAEMLGDLGEIAANLSDYPGSEALLKRAVDESGALYGADSVETAQALERLAYLRFRQGHRDEAEQLARRALDNLRQRGAADSLQAASVESQLANYLAFGKGAPPEAMQLVDDALRIFELRDGRDHPDTINALNRRASLLEQARRDAEAERDYRDTVARLERSRGPDAVALARPLRGLGLVLARAGKVDEAERCYLRSIAILRPQVGERDHDLATNLSSLGMFYEELSRTEDAERVLKQAIAALPEDDSPARGDALRHLGRVYLDQKRYDEAESAMREAYELKKSTVGDGNAFTWFFATEWGRALAGQGRIAEAEAIQRSALQHITQLMGTAAYQIALIDDFLADTLEKKPAGRAEAEALRRRALALTEAKYPKEHPLWANRALLLASNLAQLDTPLSRTEAMQLLDTAIVDDRATPRQASDLLAALLLRAQLYMKQRQRDSARSDAAEALAILAKAARPDADKLQHAQALMKQLGG